MKMSKVYITKFDELKVCFIHSPNDLYEPGVREMQKHNNSASEHGICDESEVPELTS